VKAAAEVNTEQGTLTFTRASDSTLLIKFSGAWHLSRDVPSAALLRRELESASTLNRIAFDTSGLTHWDSGLFLFWSRPARFAACGISSRIAGGCLTDCAAWSNSPKLCPRRKAPMPVLCLYADFLGIVGGLFVGVGMLDLSARNYLQETISTLTLTNLFGGLLKATLYGFLIALAGCLRGFQCGNSSSAVGDAATQAVVMSIVMVVVACGLFAVVFNVIGI
jgi:hypothetical protein